jgi:hypothetical protein
MPGGLGAPVDLAEGTLFARAIAHEQADFVHHHPDSGARIVGRPLPWWKETLDLCRVAHRYFPYPFVGWDVAITEAGPHLVEANLVWCADLVQVTNAVPLGGTAFQSVFLNTIDSREEAR